MPDVMPEKDAAFIEAECLKVARRALGCSHLQSVRIGPLKPTGSAPNWEVYRILSHFARNGARRSSQGYCTAPAKIRVKAQRKSLRSPVGVRLGGKLYYRSVS